MGKKQFIRHLEFYGFPDQNKYFSDANCGDLSFIIDKLNELDLEKADKDTLEEFEETVNEEIDSLKDADEVLNGRLSSVESSITTISEDIETLKNADEAFDIRLNSAESSITVINDNVEEINENIDTIKSEISEINDGIIEITDEISGITINVSELSGNLDTFKEYAEETYSKKSDVYTKEEVYNKEEIDEMIPSGQSGYATVEWVEEQGFLTEDSGNTIYVRQDDFSIYSGDVNNSLVELSNSIETIDDKVDNNYNEFSAYTAYAPTIFARKTLEEDVANLTADVLNDEANIQKLSGDTELINENVNTLSAQVMTNKTNISRCADAIRTKANKQDLNDTRIELQGEIDELNDKKADKTDIEVLSGAIDNNTALITAETANRMSEDRIINNRVDILAEKVQSAESTVRSYDVRITNLENGLEQEITDREQQKLDLIGREDDPSTGNTIWAAKNKADEIFNTAITSAKTYTDTKCDDLYHQFDELSAKTDTELTKFAKKSYVDDRFNEVKRVLRSEIKSGVESAMTYTDDEIAKLDNNIQELDDFVRHPVSGLSVTVNTNSTILNAFTSWDGEGEYSDSGTGIVDVMHRELHGLEQGGIEKFWVNGENLEIIASNPNSGETAFDVPISEIIDKDDYYKKEEVDALLAEKEAEIDALNKANATLKDIVGSIGGNVEWAVPGEGKFSDLMKKNGTVKLTEDTTSATFAGGLTSKNKTMLNLNGKNLTFSGTTTNNPGIMTRGKENLTIIGKGTLDAAGRIAVEANGADSVINLSGTTGMFGSEPTYVTDRSGGELIYCYLGTINISAGVFKNNGDDKTFLLNCYDANYRTGTAKIIVTGGKFYDFDPSNAMSEPGAPVSYLAPGYHVETSTVVEEGVEHTIYTVKKD